MAVALMGDSHSHETRGERYSTLGTCPRQREQWCTGRDPPQAETAVLPVRDPPQAETAGRDPPQTETAVVHRPRGRGKLVNLKN